MRDLALLAVLVLMPLANTTAQDVALQPGQWVRVTAPDFGLKRHEGTLQEWRGDTLVFRESATWFIPVTSLERIDQRVRRARPWRGLGAGALGGFLIGFLAYGACNLDVGGGVGTTNRSELCEKEAGYFLTRFTAGGALLGGVAGLIIKVDSWEEVPLDRLRVSIVPRRDGFGIGARIVF